MIPRLSLFAMSFVIGLAGCHGEHGVDLPGNANDHLPFHGVQEDEVVRITGAEPFWSGEVKGGQLTYATPEKRAGTVIPVRRFAGRGGISFSGQLGSRAMTLAVTPGNCSDGMSDRRYPFVVTLRLGDDLRQGCGWTARQPWTKDK